MKFISYGKVSSMIDVVDSCIGMMSAEGEFEHKNTLSFCSITGVFKPCYARIINIGKSIGHSREHPREDDGTEGE